MWFLALGLLGIGLKFFDVGMATSVSWWVVLSPFALAAAWWAWSDASGLTRRRVMQREDERKRARIDRQRVSMGLKPITGGKPRR